MDTEVARTGGPMCVTVTIRGDGGGWRDVSAQRTACPQLVIVPAARGSAAGFSLIDTLTGRSLAACDEPEALGELAQRLAWFDSPITDPRFLTDPANADYHASVSEIIRHWRIEHLTEMPLPAIRVGGVL